MISDISVEGGNTISNAYISSAEKKKEMGEETFSADCSRSETACFEEFKTAQCLEDGMKNMLDKMHDNSDELKAQIEKDTKMEKYEKSCLFLSEN